VTNLFDSHQDGHRAGVRTKAENDIGDSEAVTRLGDSHQEGRRASVMTKAETDIGKDSHLLQQYLRNMGVTHITNKSAEDPEAKGLVEAFMKHLKKIFHTAGVEKEDPHLRLNEYLMQHRATPHSTMEKSPAELLFGRRFNTRLPDLRTNPARDRKDISRPRRWTSWPRRA
jgi:hypothetical protein